jgi:putative tryptophan/tyrosine transport system substrate-binding protein
MGSGEAMRRREFIMALGLTATWPFAARAQEGERVRRVGVLMGWTETDPEFRSWLAAFVQEFARLGWVDGGNVLIDQRWTNYDAARARTLAKELVELQPDVIFTGLRPRPLHCTGRPARSRSSLRLLPILLAQASSPVSRDQVAT